MIARRLQAINQIIGACHGFRAGNSKSRRKMFMKSILSAVCCFALCCPPAFAQKKGAPKGAGMTDQQFVDFAAQTDMTEAHLGQMAADQAAAQDVKDYAQMLVTDHTSNYRQLSDVAG